MPGNVPIRLTLTSDDKPSASYVSDAIAKLKQIDSLIIAACELILDNYSYEHYKRLGVPEERLERRCSRTLMNIAISR